MTASDIKRVGVIGAGTMGRGIAQICAMAGYQTVLYDLDTSVVQKAVEAIHENLEKGVARKKISEGQWQSAKTNLSTTSSLSDLQADIVIEAIIEDQQAKRKVFEDLEKINSPETIIATNTSALSITQMGAGMQHSNRFLGLHFFNPAHVMRLVEVVCGVATDQKTIELTTQFVESLNKQPVVINDGPGFIVNRVARPFYVEALKVLEDKVADIETIDSLIRASGFKMGPFELMDLIGVDVNHQVTTNMYEAFNHEAKFRPSRIQQQKVDAGFLGRKSGKGFYDYE